MKILKKKFKKVLVRRTQEGIVIKPPDSSYKPQLRQIKIKPKLGRWCNYYEGRLPFPMECSNNKLMPISKLFKGKEVMILHDRSNCINCKRAPQFLSWKRGDWYKIMKAIEKGEDLRDMDSPNQETR